MRPPEQQPYIDDTEIIEETRYYYYVKVIEDKINDHDPDIPISDASIDCDDMESIQLTTHGGICKWTENKSPIRQVKIVCPGYVTMIYPKLTGNPNGFPSIPVKIEMEKKVTVGYHYKIMVKDRSTNQPIPNVRIIVKNVNGDIVDNDIINQTQSDGTFVFYDDNESSLKFITRINGYVEKEVVVTGSTNTPTLTTILLDKDQTADYYYVISVKDTTGNPVKNAEFKLYKDFGYNTEFDLTRHLTNASGYIIINLGRLQTKPADIYAKGISLPAGYDWDTVTQGRVQPTLNSSAVGLSVTVKQYIAPTIYYYNIKVTDSLTDTAVKDVSATFSYDGETLSRKTTNADGVVFFSSNYSSVKLTLTMSKYVTGYETGVSLAGNPTSNSYRHIVIEPENTIYVQYEDNSPAAAVYVKLYTIDEHNNSISLGRYKSASNGYLKTVPVSYFDMDILKATVTGYKNIFIIESGHNVLTINRKQSSSQEHDSKLEKYSKLSSNGVKESINHDKVIYEGGDDYRIKILDPDSVTTFDIFTSLPVMMYNNKKKSVIGSVDVGLKPDVNDLRLKVINRYSGYYNPIFKDILFFENFWVNKKQLPYTNTTFDYKYKDNQGSFGVINNMWFHKVNDNKDLKIIDTLTPYYPLTGQYALDYRDYNIFSSNWDMNYYTRQTGIDMSEMCNNIASMKNGLCMFGSKYLNVPETIVINGLTIGDDDTWYGEWNDDWITNPEGCPGEMMYKEVNNNSVDFYFFLTKRIIRYMTDKLYDEFKKYVAENNSFGKPGIEDDIEEYVRKNVLKLYKLEKVRMFVRRTKKGLHNSRIENNYTKYLEYYVDPKTGDYIPVDVDYFKKHGFVEVNTVTLTKMNRDDFDRKLVYNLRNGSQEEFGFVFILRKI